MDLRGIAHERCGSQVSPLKLYSGRMEQHSYCTRRDREVIRKNDGHEYAEPTCYPVCVRVNDLFGNETRCLLARSLG
jgi:hypothetical protein